MPTWFGSLNTSEDYAEMEEKRNLARQKEIQKQNDKKREIDAQHWNLYLRLNALSNSDDSMAPFREWYRSNPVNGHPTSDTLDLDQLEIKLNEFNIVYSLLDKQFLEEYEKMNALPE